MKIIIASDHRGYKAKELIKPLLKQLGHEYVDIGCDKDETIDYPDLAYSAAVSVSQGEADRAILICGTGIGMCITANKVKGIRAALCYDELTAKISRQHNDANILCLSGDLLGDFLIQKITEHWLESEFIAGRHARRVDKIKLIDQGATPKDFRQ
ncbi:Putative sugar phosphate isomerase YwlF [Limihaloglobus sulfuriphilus]|uniref:Putative sugar phosphate isomerase YwlF n=1 Tax=Limihaloglobus sulfuriphilus TaxID=1851148 RepID=A0A1Q2MCT3_9BACT|nr:ribose 5-phosphate isomerase B [Limihaloglobus sulfuriphilus]AQQ70459.1 Putative sugar phosphate isomerase YwlF [Limihaloglobus sulfuriphilus]